MSLASPTDVSVPFAYTDTSASASPTASPSPSPSPSADPEYTRDVTLTLKRHLKAKGKVTAEEGATSNCTSGVPVDIQRKTKNGWKDVKSTNTDGSGKYSVRLKDKKGRYRASISELIENDVLVCLSDKSGTEKHKHKRR